MRIYVKRKVVEMAQWLRVPSSLSEDSGSIPKAAHNVCNFSSGEANALVYPPEHLRACATLRYTKAHTHTK